MVRKRYSGEDVLRVLRQIDVHLHYWLNVVSFCHKAGISDKTQYYWRSCKMLTVLDKYTPEAPCLAVRSEITANDVFGALHPVLMKHGIPEFIRSVNGPELVALHFHDWQKRVGIQPLLIYPGSTSWENGQNERFNGTLRQEVLDSEWSHNIKQAEVAINVWFRQYNQIRPHHALGMKPPVPETVLEKAKISGTEKWDQTQPVKVTAGQIIKTHD